MRTAQTIITTQQSLDALATSRVPSEEEALLKRIDDVSRNPEQGDAFRLRIDYRVTPSALPSRFGICDGVRAQMLFAMEPWLQRLSGDAKGYFDVTVYHESQQSQPMGLLRVPLANGRAIEPKFQFSALTDPEYTGPRKFSYPVAPAPTTLPFSPPQQQFGQPAQHNGTGELAAVMGTIMQMQKSSEERLERALARITEHQQRPVGDNGEAARLALAREERLAREAQAKEEREKYERERKERDEREERQRTADRERDRADREREDRQRAADRERDREHLNQMMAVLTKKPETDPLQQTLLAKALDSRDGMTEKFAGLMAAQGTFMTQMTQMTMQLLHTQAELAPGPSESPFWGLARTAIEAYMASAGIGQQELEDGLEEMAGTPKKLPAGEAATAKPSSEAGEEDAEVEEREEGAPPDDVIEHPLHKLDRLLTGMAPLREVADALCLALLTPELKQLFAEHKGNVRDLIMARYGDWVRSLDVDAPQRAASTKERIGYLSKVLPASMKAAADRGILGQPPAAAAHQQKRGAKPQAAKAKNRDIAPAVTPTTPASEAPQADVVKFEKPEKKE